MEFRLYMLPIMFHCPIHSAHYIICISHFILVYKTLIVPLAQHSLCLSLGHKAFLGITILKV
jgi:hypothetical protein